MSLEDNVFNNQQNVQATQQQVSNGSVPVELITLPSKGSVYAVGHPLSNEEFIEIKSMTAKEEDILTSRALIKKGAVISELLRSCIMNKVIDANDMLVGDRNAVLIGIRVTGYGPAYNVSISCPHCNTDFENSFNLGNLKIKPLTATPLQQNVNLFEYVLPSSGAVVHFRLLTGKDESEIAKILESKSKTGQTDGNVTTRLFQSIVSINGETDKQKLAYAVQNMKAIDARSLRQYMDKIDPGVDMKQSVACTKCYAESEVEMPLGVSFFWPDIR